MNERDTLSVLQSDIVIPEIVQEKANMAFQEIHEMNAIDRREQKNNQMQRRKPHMRKRGVILLC